MLKNRLFSFFLFLMSFITLLEAQSMNPQTLSLKQQSIITISAFTANGDMDRLKPALIKGLDAGLSVNEIKEAMVQLYAYTGFPRSLNALGAFKNVLEEREKQGIKDTIGKEATPLPANFNKDEYGARVRAELLGQKEIPKPSGYQLFAPTIDTFLKEHLFADIFARDILNHQTRELVTISALASMMGTAPQLQAHLSICLNVGWRQEQLEAFTMIIQKHIGDKEAETAKTALKSVLKK